jgi:putative transposase
VPVLAVPPQYTTQACSGCGTLVQKTLSTRTHVCWHCSLILDRDANAARNILALALVLWEPRTSDGTSTAGQAGTGSG